MDVTHPPRRAVLFANLRSGRATRRLPEVVEACHERGIVVESAHFDLSPGSVDRALEQARGEGIDVALAAGGDGTIGSIAAHLAHTDWTLGVLPCGTSNDFARSLQIPMDPEGAVGVIAGGLRTKVNLGEAGGRIFGHAAILGLNTQFAETAQHLRSSIGRLSYPVSAIRVFLQRQTFRATVRSDGDARSLDALELAFVNAPVYGGALELEVPDASLTDERLSVLVVDDVSIETMLRELPRALRRRELLLPGVHCFGVRACRVETNTPMRVTIDGELAGTTPMDVRVLPAALNVFIPPAFQRMERERAAGG